jgi:hypothetical protein
MNIGKTNSAISDGIPPRFGVVICVGPGDYERCCFEDFANSLFHYEPGVALLAVVDDAIPARPLLERVQLSASCQATVIANPRQGQGSGWAAGLTAAMIAGFRWLHDHGELSFVLKADTDTLIVAPFAAKVHQQFLANPAVGMLGSGCRKYPDRPRVFVTERYNAPSMEKLLRQVTIWRRTYSKWPRLQLGFFGKYGRIRAILRQALLNGYVLGENCLGGGYAISGVALGEMRNASLLDEPLLWIYTPCGEDVVISLFIKRVCRELADFNGVGEPFGVSVKHSPFTPEEIIERGYAIVHSVKSCGGKDEATTRSFFAACRTTPAKAQTTDATCP